MFRIKINIQSIVIVGTLLLGVVTVGLLASPGVSAATSSSSSSSSSADKADHTGIPETNDPALKFGTCKDADHCNLVKTYVNPLIKFFLAPMAILAVIIGVIWGSIEFATSGGDPQRVAVGKGHIQKSLIGLLTFMFLYALLNWLIPGGI